MSIEERIHRIVNTIYYTGAEEADEPEGLCIPSFTEEIQSLIDDIVGELTSDEGVPNVMIAAEHAHQRICYKQMKGK